MIEALKLIAFWGCIFIAGSIALTLLGIAVGNWLKSRSGPDPIEHFEREVQ